MLAPAKRTALVAAAFVLAASIPASSLAEATDPPVLPRLDAGPPAVTSPRAVPPSDSAQKLPETATVCRDAAARRCFRARGEDDCQRDGAEVFRTVITAPGRTDVATALAQCEAELREDRGRDAE
jgi:hypothetical protein